MARSATSAARCFSRKVLLLLLLLPLRFVVVLGSVLLADGAFGEGCFVAGCFVAGCFVEVAAVVFWALGMVR
ncbi:MAG: hypothetical protein ACYDEN_03795 [Acidimicrobiales bacterium]